MRSIKELSEGVFARALFFVLCVFLLSIVPAGLSIRKEAVEKRQMESLTTNNQNGGRVFFHGVNN
ncbi:MAG: hypothetical protein HY280_00195 [Nitrospinae bacterium]|nr:hypothetical protein [Nitrospinota bacterium]